VIERCGQLLQSVTLFDCRHGGHHQPDGPIVNASDVMGHSCFHLLPGCFRRICVWRMRVPAAEAKQAVDTSLDTLRIPRPPDNTGRLSCIHWSSVRDVLQILVTADRKKSLNLVKIEWPQQGGVRMTYWSLGPPLQTRFEENKSVMGRDKPFNSYTSRSPYIADNESFKA